MAQAEQVDGAIIAAVTSFLEDYTFPSASQLSTAKDDIGLVPSHHCPTEMDALEPWTDDDTCMSALAPVTKSYDQEEANTNQRQRTKRTVDKDAERKLRYRRKLRTERETLLKQSIELTRAVENLRSSHAEKLREQEPPMALAAWKAIATRQKEKRLEVEELQKRLRAAVISRSRVIEQMNSFLQSSDPARCVALCGHERAAGRSMLIDTFVDELDMLYSQTDQIVRCANFKVAPSMEFSLTPKRNGELEYFESAYATTVPFGFEQTVKAMSSLTLSDWGKGYDKKVVKKPGCTVGCTFDLDYHLKSGETAKLQGSLAVRKFDEADRAVFLMRSLTECPGDFVELYSDETSWMILRPSSTDPATNVSCGDNGVSTVVEIYSRVVQTGQSSPAIADRFAEVIAKTSEEDVVEILETLEKVLLDN
ncbi:hypothetical protein PHYBOEH_008785 [Phytophthora boehmeriae]|uniref:M96 mating-specific protein family n=1 Tax=Phytophthora boehmeriae TaxID=109152 RepID=A0A8T1VXQ1_9STRA|nr:hypothetical protein PHYBOEH_008785 [Phytophthora boehmeriae]